MLLLNNQTQALIQLDEQQKNFSSSWASWSSSSSSVALDDPEGAAIYVIVVIGWYFLGVAAFIAWQMRKKKMPNDYKTELLYEDLEDHVKTKQILEELGNPNMRRWAWDIYGSKARSHSNPVNSKYESQVLANLNKRLQQIKNKRLKFKDSFTSSDSPSPISGTGGAVGCDEMGRSRSNVDLISATSTQSKITGSPSYFNSAREASLEYGKRNLIKIKIREKKKSSSNKSNNLQHTRSSSMAFSAFHIHRSTPISSVVRSNRSSASLNSLSRGDNRRKKNTTTTTTNNNNNRNLLFHDLSTLEELSNTSENPI